MGFAECIEVALPIPVDATFRYGVPEGWRGKARVGCRVVVPFGSRRLVGVVTEAATPVARPSADAPDAGLGQGSLFPETKPTGDALRALERVLDVEPVLSGELLRVLREYAVRVFCPVGVALAAALPGAGAPRARRVFRMSAQGRDAFERGAFGVRAAIRP